MSLCVSDCHKRSVLDCTTLHQFAHYTTLHQFAHCTTSHQFAHYTTLHQFAHCTTLHQFAHSSAACFPVLKTSQAEDCSGFLLPVQNSTKCQPGASHPGMLGVRRTPCAIHPQYVLINALQLLWHVVPIPSSQDGAPAPQQLAVLDFLRTPCDMVVRGEGVLQGVLPAVSTA